MKWEIILDKKSLLKQIEDYLYNYFVRFDYINDETTPIMTFEPEGTEKLAKWLKSQGFILEYITGSDLGQKIELIYQFGLRSNNSYGTFLFRSIVKKERTQESITYIYPSARFWQHNIRKRLGLNFYSIHKPLLEGQKVNLFYPISLNVPGLLKSHFSRMLIYVNL